MRFAAHCRLKVEAPWIKGHFYTSCSVKIAVHRRRMRFIWEWQYWIGMKLFLTIYLRDHQRIETRTRVSRYKKMIHGKNEKEKAQLSPYVLLYVDCNAVFFYRFTPHSPQPWQSDKASFFNKICAKAHFSGWPCTQRRKSRRRVQADRDGCLRSPSPPTAVSRASFFGILWIHPSSWHGDCDVAPSPYPSRTLHPPCLVLFAKFFGLVL